ncbi:unnamed protein product, partial [Lymnaea stagnalis]
DKLSRSNSTSGPDTGLYWISDLKLNSTKEVGSEQGQEGSTTKNDGAVAVESSTNEAAGEATKKHKHPETLVKGQKAQSKLRSRKNDSLRSTVSLGNRGCQEGTGAPVPVNFLKSSQSTEVLTNEYSDYNEIFHKSTENQLTEIEIEKLKARGFSDVGNAAPAGETVPQEPEDEFDDVASESDGQNEDSFDWGSEFSDEEVGTGMLMGV